MEPAARWLQLGRPIPVTVTVASRGDASSAKGAATLYARTLDRNGRLLRSAKILGICWALAVLSLPILVFHFVLVPGFLIAGVFFFFVCLKEEQVVLGAIVSCPVCKEDTRLKGRVLEWPVQLDCSGCHKGLDLQPQSAPGGES